MQEIFFSLLVVSLVLLFAIAGVVFDEPYFVTLATKIVILGIAGMGLNLVLGYGGLVSLGHAAFFGFGGYISAISSIHFINGDPINFWLFELSGSTSMIVNWIWAVCLSLLLAILIGSISIRTSGVYFIMITLAFAQMLYYFSVGWPKYGGEDGLSIYYRNEFFSANTMDPINFFLICFGWLCIVGFFLSWIVNSTFGMFLKGCKDNEEKMISLGVEAFYIKLMAFIISGGIVGLAGSLYVDLNRFVSPTAFSWYTSGEILIFVILGGSMRVFGPLVGAAAFILLEQFFGGITESWQFWLGLILLLIVLYLPKGIAGFFVKEKRNA